MRIGNYDQYSSLNLVHIRPVDGLDTEMGVLIPALVVGYVLLVGWTMLLARYFVLAPLEREGSEPND